MCTRYTEIVVDNAGDIAECTGMKINEVATAAKDRDHWRGILRAANPFYYPRDAMLARVIAIATCLSVRLSIRLSRAGIVSKRRKLAS